MSSPGLRPRVDRACASLQARHAAVQRCCQRRRRRARPVAAAGGGGGGGESGSSPPGAAPAGRGAAALLPFAFGGLAATSLALGAAALAAPGQLLPLVAGVAATPLDETFLRIAGGTLAISVAVEFALADAAANGRLGSATYRRLLLALVVKNALYLAAFGMASDVWTPALVALYPTAPLASLAAAAAALSSPPAAGGAAGGGAGGALSGLFSRPASGAGWAYAAFALLYAATLAACYAPEAIFTGATVTPVGLLLKHTWAPGFWMCGAACLVLRDAADRGRLGATTFKRLNLGLAAVEAAYSACFAAAIASGLAPGDGAAASNLAGSVGIAAFCLWQGLTAKKEAK
ncbi:hypothetical protein Rsub_00030 [Raphidocelis subcapitata]|uniref:Uncharacterized protein n=1 Tax=Raphidocelis subcapitata TaxID=307507 RepID=A0A2V0NK24_9CHLO|nr:hypothetical protein Rsub_00030 [Raphidocelis subcapitata]|eukprot:GBF87319.1 hypothetical protein Rsub_00030 [Raphidocelis subcapitata]